MFIAEENPNCFVKEETNGIECQTNRLPAGTNLSYLKGAVATPLVALSKNPEHTQQLLSILSRRQSSEIASTERTFNNSSNSNPNESGLSLTINNNSNEFNSKQENFKVDKGIFLYCSVG